jgi:two-component system phosphate regulon sensor histidine kinase PhoR
VIVLGMSFYLYASAKERRLSQLRSEFVSNVTHELKTPLSLIKMFSELLLMGKITDEAQRRRYFEVLNRESDRLAALIDTVLDFSRLERGKTHYEKVATDAGELARRAVEMVRLRLEREMVELKLHVDDGLPEVLADEQALMLAVINLLDNALKYAEGTKEIRVEVRSEGAAVRIVVADDGPGIPPEELKRVFDRFYRGKAAARSRARGSGIGLSIVQAVAAGHDGRAWVESAPGHGATFIIELPRLTT